MLLLNFMAHFGVKVFSGWLRLVSQKKWVAPSFNMYQKSCKIRDY